MSEPNLPPGPLHPLSVLGMLFLVIGVLTWPVGAGAMAAGVVLAAIGLGLDDEEPKS